MPSAASPAKMTPGGTPREPPLFKILMREQGCIRSPTVTGERHEDDSGWRDEPQQLIADLRTFRCCLLPLYRDGPDRPFRLGRRGQACCRQGLRLTD
jgi:hypothetical protein